ncbi:MAG TPA: translocation/assembly module TamB domain-containing protein, partial [Ohtaekwangia sp.]|nr:translocation/assembly module TamB domain-containing protein [Ohtaekwangia sp.]
EEKYFLGGVINSFEDAFQFRFLQNHIKLNYEEWETPLYNSLRFTNAGLDPNNFWIRKGNERILLLKQNNADSTLSIVFNEVDLKNITSLVEGTTPISGIMNGDVNLGSAQQASFNTDFRIKNLNILEQPWGDLALLLGKEGNNPLDFKLTVNGENAEMNASGVLTSDEEPVIDLRAAIPRLNLAIVEPLTMGQLKNLTGELSATLDVHGKTKDPAITARLSIHKADFMATYVNSEFSIVNENIDYRESVLTLDKFEIFDRKKNSAVINGSLASLDQAGWDLNLSLDADNFQLLNTTAKDNDLFYGNVRINTAATIRGTSILPVIKMDVSLVEGSQVTYVVPQSEKGILDQKGIVVFVDKDAKQDPFMAKINPNDTVKSTFSGMDLTANIALTDQESFNVIIDPLTGDNLAVKGNSTLTLHMDPSGEMELTGRYEISEGSYDLSFYKLVKRKFLIMKGSTMTWSGDPMNAQMNISALYEVETSPIELVANQVGDDELARYKEMLPFQVFLMIKGELLSPEISFRLDMPEDEQNAFGGNVYAKIQDINTRESDLNKQVFALLLLKRFISDNPFENKAAGGLASSARTSVSKILSEQLNRLSSNVKGVELSFDLKSYEGYSSGKAEGRTDLELGVSKSLLNDRLVVKVAGNVNLEGETADQQNSVTDFIGDLALEYKLTEDGRFRITGFRNSNYDMIDGDLIETGAGLIYIKDYDSLRELFKANEKDN